MRAPKVQLRSRLSSEKAESMLGNRLTMEHISVIANQDVDVYKPDGKPLIFLRRKAISEDVSRDTYPILHHIGEKYKTNNRGTYAGKDMNGETIASAIVGYFNRVGGRFPFCRATAFTAQEEEKWKGLLPLV